MTKHTESAYAPIERNTPVSWTPEQAFQRFTTEFSQWWPTSTHSIGGKLVKRVVFECRLGGLIYEEFTDGRRFQWGKITAWDPPRCVGFTWHPSQHASEAQDVEVRFVPEPGADRGGLLARGCARVGARAARAEATQWAGARSSMCSRDGAPPSCCCSQRSRTQ